MSTTVRISKKDKERLDQLARYLSFKAQRKITQEELIASLIASGEQSKEKLGRTFQDPGTNPEPIDPSDPFFNVPSFHLGKRASKEHDKLIYGGD